MCNKILTNGNKCKKSKNIEFCHLHKKKITNDSVKKLIFNSINNIKEKDIIIEKLQIEYNHLTSFNNILLNEFDKNKEIIDNKCKEIKNLNKTINNKNIEIKNMKDDYNKYQIIKRYSYIQNTMKNIFGNNQPYKIIDNIQNKEKLEYIFNIPYEHISKYYYELRNQRILYAHS